MLASSAGKGPHPHALPDKSFLMPVCVGVSFYARFFDERASSFWGRRIWFFFPSRAFYSFSFFPPPITLGVMPASLGFGGFFWHAFCFSLRPRFFHVAAFARPGVLLLPLDRAGECSFLRPTADDDAFRSPFFPRMVAFPPSSLPPAIRREVLSMLLGKRLSFCAPGLCGFYRDGTFFGFSFRLTPSSLRGDPFPPSMRIFLLLLQVFLQHLILFERPPPLFHFGRTPFFFHGGSGICSF